MPLQINTTRGQIGIRTQNASQSIRNFHGEQKIETTMPKVKIKSEKPRVIIDQYQCFAEAGLKNNADLTKDMVEYAKMKHKQMIDTIVADGNRMANIKNGTPPAIPEIAEKNARGPEKQFRFGPMPSSRPKIEVEGSLDISWEMGKVNISYTPRKPQITYNPGKVEVYLKQKPSIDIQYVDTRR